MAVNSAGALSIAGMGGVRSLGLSSKAETAALRVDVIPDHVGFKSTVSAR